MERYTILEVKQDYERKLEGAKGHTKTRYTEALKILRNIDDSMIIAVRKKDTFIIGDVVEAVLKGLLGQEAQVSSKFQKDLEKTTYNEIKTFTSSNSPAGRMTEPKGFIAILSHGAYYIKKELVAEMWDTFKPESDGTRKPTRPAVESIIELNDLQPHYYSKTLGLI